MIDARRFRPLLACFVALGLLSGCAKAKITRVGDLPPTTSIFVQFTPDSLAQNHAVNHLVHLYWSGSDPDGDVVGFDIRFVRPGQIPPDTVQWFRTTRHDSLMAVYTPTGYAIPIFQVRAVDNAGLVDPNPATQQFAFTNQPPTLRLVTPPRTTDTTYASLTLRWVAVDPDGNSGNMRFLVWLDGSQANPTITQSNPYTLPTGSFKRNGRLVSGPRTVWVQPVDDGGMMGARDSATWFMRAPVGGNHGRLLLLDDLPPNSSLPARYVFDSLYTNLVNRLLPGQYDVLRTEFSQPFRSSKDIQQTFALFDAVVWYRGPRSDVTPYLANYQDGIDSVLASGGRLFIEGLNLFQGQNANGILRPSFLTRFLDTDYLIMHQVTGRFDSTVTWGIGKGASLWVPPSADSLRALALSTQLQAFAVRDPADIAILAPAGTLQPPNPVDVAIGVTARTPAGGRFIVVTAPLALLNGFVTSQHVITEFLRELGVP
jgi:hypothetical protein